MMPTHSALDTLADWLRWNHPEYTVDDVVPSNVEGYLRCTKPCSRTGHWYCNHVGEFYHTLCVPAYYKGYERGAYAFWRAVCAELRERGYKP